MATKPLSDLTATWNAGGTTFTAIKMNVTDTASAAASLLLDLQVGGASQFRVSKGGAVSVGSTIELGHASDTTLARGSAGVLTVEGNTVYTSSNLPGTAITWTAAQTILTGNSTDIGLRLNNTNTSGFSVPWVEAIGSRNDGNQTFGARYAAAFRRSDGSAIATGTDLGGVLFGGQHGTSTSYQAGNVLYAASIMGEASGTFTNSTTMPTDIVFRTGSSGALVTAVNERFGTERMRITSGGAVTIGGNTVYHAGNLPGTAITWTANQTLSNVDLVLATGAGTKIGTATNQKLGFFNATPVVQPTAVADATDAASVITQLNALLSRMRTLGLIAT